MTTQPSLFTPNAYGGAEPPIARRTDPASIHRAAARVRANARANSQGEIILAILRRPSPSCTTVDVSGNFWGGIGRTEARFGRGQHRLQEAHNAFTHDSWCGRSIREFARSAGMKQGPGS